MKVSKLTFSAAVGALYAVLTFALAPISFGAFQFRVSEALCILPFFFPFSAWGLFVGCALVNLLGGNGVLDIIFGSLATLLAAFCTARIKCRPLAVLPPVLINGVVVGAVLAFTLTPENLLQGFALMGLQVAFGEFVVMYALGLPLIYLLPRFRQFSSLCDKLAKK